MILRCTGKLLKEMGIHKSRLVEAPETGNDWYAHMFYFLRGKCIIFTHAQTLFTLAISGLKRAEIRDIDEVFTRRLGFV